MITLHWQLTNTFLVEIILLTLVIINTSEVITLNLVIIKLHFEIMTLNLVKTNAILLQENSFSVSQ